MMPSPTDLKDYEAIRQAIPKATPKQTKWIKELCDMARTLGFPDGWILQPMASIHEDLRLQTLANLKSSLGRRLKKRSKPTNYEQCGQIELFHPEAFQGGENQTLREM